MHKLKKNITGRIKGFTLIELTVAMLISGFAVAAALSAYLTIESYYYRLKDRNESVTEILLFQNVIKQDLRNADIIQYNNNKLIFTETNSNTIKYIFNDYEVLRNKIGTDTFKVEAELLKVYTDDYNEKLVTGADIIILSEKIEIPINLRKIFTHEQLFLREVENLKLQ